MILHNEFKPFSKLVYDDDDDDGNVSTYRILGSLEILAIKKESQKIFTCLFSCDATISWTGELFSAGAA